MKDFAQQFLAKDKAEEFRDPLLYLTKEVEEQTLQIQSAVFTNINICNFIGVILTGPFQTIASSLQLSVKPHKTIFNQPASKGTQIAKLNTSLTIQQKRRMELALRSGGDHKPYTAPVYDGYIATIKGLASQGPKAFFKGLFFRSIHQLFHYAAFTQISIMSTTKQGEEAQVMGKILKIFALQCLGNISFNFLHIAENRYILQNIIPEFKVFRNANRVIQKLFLNKEILIGYKYHILNTFSSLFFQLPFIFTLSNQVFYPVLASVYYCSQIFMYPFNTAFRRLACQHTQIPGMIPVRYKSIWHAVRLIFQQQGILGLYGGFGIYHLIMGIKLGVVVFSKAFQQKISSHPLH